ncbi:MAG: T9SS type A sorting domain-containing protein, partial [Bacteroidales bacterium]|nr:T9SS type A sorting domain-containing protein [Bacteroidales bacterium]
SYELEVQVTDNAPQPKNARAKIHINLIGQSTVVYIDPLNNQDILANGSIDHPYDSWMDVTWKNGYTYLQKKGTSLSVEKIFLGASNVKLGAYGEGDLPVISSKTTTYLLSAFEKDNIVIENLQFDAPDATSCFYFLGSSIENIVIEHCKLVGNVNGIKAVGVSSFTSKYNVITSDHEGIYSTAENNDIYYNIFKLCKTAINVMSYQSDANVYNNVFYNNQQSLALTYASLKLFNNIFYMSSPDQKALSLGNGEIESDHNIFYPDQSGFVTIANKIFNNLDELQRELRIDLNSFNSDPMFVDIFSQNFSLSPESPAINAGTNLNLVLDLEGSSVPVAGNPDIGSIEFGQQIQKNPGNIEQESILKLYPNPSNGQFTLFAELEQDNTLNSQLSAAHPEIKIMDVSGKLVFIRNMEKTGSIIQENIDLTGISNGLYFVMLQFADKIVKEKLLINR